MDISMIDLQKEYNSIVAECCDLFARKMEDYGPTWLFYRPVSLCDQLWIKVRRIHTLEQTGVTAVGEGREPEFVGLINYAVIMLMKMKYPEVFPSADDVIANTALADQVTCTVSLQYFRKILSEIVELMRRKNQDYGNAWAEMHPFSITDQITIKIARIKTILSHNGRVTVSENVDAQLMDVVNYSVFALIRLRHGESVGTENA